MLVIAVVVSVVPLGTVTAAPAEQGVLPPTYGSVVTPVRESMLQWWE